MVLRIFACDASDSDVAFDIDADADANAGEDDVTSAKRPEKTIMALVDFIISLDDSLYPCRPMCLSLHHRQAVEMINTAVKTRNIWND